MPTVPYGFEIPFIGFTFDRSYLAIRQDGNVYSCSWDIGNSMSYTTADMSTSGMELVFSIQDIHTFELPHTPTQQTMHTKSAYLAYSDDVWNGLQYIQQQILSVKSKLSSLLHTQEGFQRIQEIGQTLQHMLPATHNHNGDYV